MVGLIGVLLGAAALLPAADKPEDLKVEMALPQIRSWVAPVYPQEAAARKLDGWVRVRFIVDANGSVTEARALRSTDKVFEAAAIASVRQWRFDPAEDDGRKVAKCVDVVVPFSRNDHGAKASTYPPAKVTQTLAYPPVTKTVRVKDGDPEYPDSLLSRHLPGEVDVEFTVDPEGREQGLRILWATHADFIIPALAAVRGWTFQPARQGDLAVPATMQSALEFSVLDHEKADVLADNGIAVPGEAGKDYDSKPRLRIVVDPVYPYDLRLAGAEGDAVADLTVGANGRPEAIKLREATRPEFGQAWVAALACWLFDPATRGGQPVAIPITARWHFGLASSSSEFQTTERLVERLRQHETADMGPKGLDGRLRPVHQVPPFYPAALMAGKPAGEATISFIIDRTGRCRLARIDAATRPEFGWAAATAIERWVFEAPTRGGQPTDVRVAIPVDFKPGS